MQLLPFMMIPKKQINRVLQGVIAAMPAIPLIMQRRRQTSISTWVLGGIAVAVAGSLATLMFLSPRTRSRALHAAKDTYDKVNDKVLHLRDKNGVAESPMSNGLVDRGEYASTTGL